MSFLDVQRAAPVLAGRRKKSWYRRWWGIVIVVLTVFVLLYGIFLGVTTYRIYKTIRAGVASQLFTEARGGQDTPVSNGAPLVTPEASRKGSEQADVTIVEFGDFVCPFTKQTFSVVRTLMAEYANKSVQFVWRDFPISDIHPEAELVAEAGRCAHEQGKFWEYHDMLFLNQGDLSSSALTTYAQQIGLDQNAFTTCVTSRRYQQAVTKDVEAGWANGVKGTPTFFINGRKVEGVIPQNLFVQVIDRLLEVMGTK